VRCEEARVAASASWPVIFGALISLATTIVVQWFTHGFQSRRERQARDATLQAEQWERRAAFQRDTLLAVQETLSDLGRAAADTHRRLRESGNWMERHRPWSEEFRDAEARTTKLAARVFDDDLRKLLLDTRQVAIEVVTAGSYEHSAEALGRMNLGITDVNHAVGPVLRELF
jgi:hypothetical protein